MSLLGGALAGAVSGGANAAYDIADKTIDHNRRTAMDELAFKRQTALEQMRTQSAMARDEINYGRQTEQRLQDREWAEQDWQRKAAHDMRIAGMRSSSGSTSTRLDPRVDLLNKDITRLSEQLSSGMLEEDEAKNISGQISELMQMRNQLAGLPFGGGSTTNPLLADLMAGGNTITDPDDTDTPDTADTKATNATKPSPQSEPQKAGLLGLSQDQIDASPNVQAILDRRESSNAALSEHWGNFKDRFFNKDMQESERIAYDRFGDRVPLGDPEWEQWLSRHYPGVYQRRVERGEIKP